jgi:quercetin dioxygenase-like cupin family protein
MKRIIRTGFFAFIATLLLIGCNDSATTSEKSDRNTTASATNYDTSYMPAYDAAMDPLTVEAAFAKKLGDTLNIKVYEVTLKPGDSVALHTHPDNTLYVLQGGKIIITPQGAGPQEIDVKVGMAIISGSQTHSGKNIGRTTIKLLVHDIYRPRGK